LTKLAGGRLEGGREHEKQAGQDSLLWADSGTGLAIMPAPARPKIYHIVHVDRLASIIADGHLWSDAALAQRSKPGTVIGMAQIKARRLNELQLASHPGLYVGQCVPFYFCPRSIMLYLLCQANHAELTYRGGQGPIIHLEGDLRDTVAWANQAGYRWAFTDSNAGSRYFNDFCDLGELDKIDWAAVDARQWSQLKDGKQAEFLVETCFPWHLAGRIGVHSSGIAQRVTTAMQGLAHRPIVEIRTDWYY
jgi:hypothetical protein